MGLSFRNRLNLWYTTPPSWENGVTSFAVNKEMLLTRKRWEIDQSFDQSQIGSLDLPFRIRLYLWALYGATSKWCISDIAEVYWSVIFKRSVSQHLQFWQLVGRTGVLVISWHLNTYMANSCYSQPHKCMLQTLISNRIWQLVFIHSR